MLLVKIEGCSWGLEGKWDERLCSVLEVSVKWLAYVREKDQMPCVIIVELLRGDGFF